MYEACFGLKRRPFAATPDAQCFLARGPIQAALDELVVCVEQGQGIAIVSAPAGTGKTLLCERLRSELGDRFESVFLRHASFLTRRALLQTILCELNHSYRQHDEQELRLELIPAIRALRPQREALVLICDEAHQLTEDLLEELRILSDLAEHGRPLVRLVLVGQLGLEETLALPGLEALSQRIRAHICLETLDRAGSLDYIDYRLTWAGGRTDEVFTSEALDLISRAADGVPRCINQLCDHALLLAYVAEERPVAVDTIREALHDLRQLPLHWNETSLGETSHRAAVSFESESSPEPKALEYETGPAAMSFEMESIEIGADLPIDADSCGRTLPTCGSNEEDMLVIQSLSEAASQQLAATKGDEEEKVETACVENCVETMTAPDSHHETESVFSFGMVHVVAEQQPSAEIAPALHGGFVEELVLDRYAAIDAGLEPPELTQPDTASPPEVRAAPKEVTAATARVEDPLQDAEPAADKSAGPTTDNLASVESGDIDVAAAETHDVGVDNDFDSACERLDKWLPEIVEEVAWNPESIKNVEAHDEPQAASAEQPSSPVDLQEESSSLEELLGAEVCEMAEDLRRGLGQRARDNALFERLRDELETSHAEAPVAVALVEHPVEKMDGATISAETLESTHAAQVATRPYRNLFSLLRRKQQGLL